MKQFNIIDCNNGETIETIATNNGKNALRLFLLRHCLSTGFYEIHKRLNTWIMSSSFGSYYIAREAKK